jgi:hypothetical protein
MRCLGNCEGAIIDFSSLDILMYSDPSLLSLLKLVTYIYNCARLPLRSFRLSFMPYCLLSQISIRTLEIFQPHQTPSSNPTNRTPQAKLLFTLPHSSPPLYPRTVNSCRPLTRILHSAPNPIPKRYPHLYAYGIIHAFTPTRTLSKGH